MGPEVVGEAARVLRALVPGVSLTAFDFGAERWLREGVGLPPGQLDAFRRDFDAILLGAIGDARVPGEAHARDILLGLRLGLDLYVNLRPCRLRAPHLSPLAGAPPVDVVLFRENTEGMYLGRGAHAGAGTPGETWVAEEWHSRRGVERLVRAGFAWARAQGRRRVTLVDKSNAVPAHRLWREAFDAVAREHPELEARHLYADAAAMQLVLRPQELDVVVTTNLFGDLLSDLAAALVGGLGVAPSANLAPGSVPLFEPVHGSAPDLVGTGRANPFATLLSAALMLAHLGLRAEAAALEAAVDGALAAREGTPDVGGRLTTREATDVVLRRLERGASHAP